MVMEVHAPVVQDRVDDAAKLAICEDEGCKRAKANPRIMVSWVQILTNHGNELVRQRCERRHGRELAAAGFAMAFFGNVLV
jgi:hypothetical protein